MNRIVCTEVELSHGWGLETFSDDTNADLRVLVRLHGRPLGYVSLTQGQAATEPALRAAVLGELSDKLRAHLFDDGLVVDGEDVTNAAIPKQCPYDTQDLTSVTVVVCTRNRPQLLGECLRGLKRLPHDTMEVIIVDNAPADDASKHAFNEVVNDDSRFRYVREAKPGLSRARNRGLLEASGDVVAYTDDDTRVDPAWIKGLLRGFRQANGVGCVTGLVATAVIDGPAERFFDARVSWATSCSPRVYRLQDADIPLHPWAAGRFGTGANFAFRADALRALGGFDEALGAGSLTMGGEDLDIFVRVLRAGHALAYEPSALVWHTHRSDPAELERQMFAYGLGLSAYLTKYLIQPRAAVDMLRQVPSALRHMNAVTKRPHDGTGDQRLERRLRWSEWRGVLAGPLVYGRALKNQPRHNRRAVRS